MTTKPKILAFAGSTRTDSFNKKLVRIAAAGAKAAGAEVTLIDLRDYPMPLYDGDLEAKEGLPANAKKLKQIFLAHDGLLISSPEYNSSISAVLKNTIDWVSRPEGEEKSLACYLDKTAVLVSASPGGLGGMRGLVHLRAILGNIKVTVLPDSISIAEAHNVFTPEGALKDAKRQSAVEQLGALLATTITKLRA